MAFQLSYKDAKLCLVMNGWTVLVSKKRGFELNRNVFDSDGSSRSKVPFKIDQPISFIVEMLMIPFIDFAVIVKIK